MRSRVERLELDPQQGEARCIANNVSAVGPPPAKPAASDVSTTTLSQPRARRARHRNVLAGACEAGCERGPRHLLNAPHGETRGVDDHGVISIDRLTSMRPLLRTRAWYSRHPTQAGHYGCQSRGSKEANPFNPWRRSAPPASCGRVDLAPVLRDLSLLPIVVVQLRLLVIANAYRTLAARPRASTIRHRRLAISTP